jgi:hypothetical protein
MDINIMMEVMNGFSNGKNIQMRKFNSTDEWKTVNEPSWDWDGYEYRVFIQNIEVRYWEYLTDNVWKMTDRRYANHEMKELAEENGYDKYQAIDKLGTETTEDTRTID